MPDERYPYDPATIEPRWQQHWERNHTFSVGNPGDAGFDADKPKYYVLDMFPYPSGAGLHVGHPEGYTATDILARFHRHRGFNVLHPMGYDAFGLPAEQYAVEHGVHPAVTTKRNIDNIRRQIKMLGFSYDWKRELSTTDEDYYRWTQWIFRLMFESWYDPNCKWTGADGVRRVGRARPIEELPIPDDVKAGGDAAVRAFVDSRRLAFIDEVPVNWCPALGTVLSNEEVTNDGRSDRGNHPVFRRPLRQWMLRITDYADRLEKDLVLVDWPESIKIMQRNWIGRSEGAEIEFPIAAHAGESLRVFTTRPDTVFGATYMVLAPEHRLVDLITTGAQRDAVAAYRDQAARKSDLERTELQKEKSGVFTGAYAINPVNEQQIPIWVADYVLASYGTGAIMAVPGQDERDWEFAEKFDLPIIRTVQPPADFDGKAYIGEGPAINSGFLDGLTIADAKAKIINWLESNGKGVRKINYKLRDWLFSRQRYWGEPFPILHGDGGEIRSIDECDLPVTLPPMDDFSPKASDDPNSVPEPPLGRAPEDWRVVQAGGRAFRRELNTMPQWAGSCWYYLRYLDPKNDAAFVGEAAERYWMPIDLYVGGAEHAVLHLLYARFWHKVLFDRGCVSTVEPFGRLFNQGMIRSFAYRDSRGVPIGYDDIDFREDGPHFKKTGEKLNESVEKMAKSLKNVVNPETVVHEYGADTLRLYEMYMGPLEASKPWNPRDVPGVHRFLQRAWRLVIDEDTGELNAAVQDVPADEDAERLIHRTIREVEDDVAAMKFNTAIAELIKFVNEMTPRAVRPKSVLERFVLLLSPFAPHLAEELWQKLRGDAWTDSLAYEPWPKYDAALAKDDEVEIAVQVNGKVKAKLMMAADASEDHMRDSAMADAKIAELIDGKTIKFVKCVPGRLVNIVAN